MPPKLPRFFRQLLGKNKSGSKHGASRTDATDPGHGTGDTPCDPDSSQMQEFIYHQSRPWSLGACPSDQAHGLHVHSPDHALQTRVSEPSGGGSSTSGYGSLSPPHSAVPEPTGRLGSADDAATWLAEGLPDLVRPWDQEIRVSSHPTHPSSPPHPGAHDHRHTIPQTPQSPSPEKTPPRLREAGVRESSSPQRSSGAVSPRCRGFSASTENMGVVDENGARSSTACVPPEDPTKGGRQNPERITLPLRPIRPAGDDVSRSSESVPVRARVEPTAGASRAAQEVGACRSGGAGPLEDMGVESEVFPQVALQTPIGALRKSRKRLCLMLNIEQPQIDTQWSPDYTGLADMLGFESLEIQNFWERNPADTLFLEWSRSQRSGRLLPPVLHTLLECLHRLGRHDVITDCRGLILEDVSDYLAEKRLLESYNVARLQKFDCYVNIAEQDLLCVGRDILQNLEGVHELRLCLTLRDVTLGGFEYEEMAKMLETRCDSKVLIVLTKSYEDSDACQFLTQFAVTLDPGSRKSKLIPLLVDEDTYIPRVLRCLAMLNYHRDKRLGFLWPRLKDAIRAGPSRR